MGESGVIKGFSNQQQQNLAGIPILRGNPGILILYVLTLAEEEPGKFPSNTLFPTGGRG